MTANTSTLTEKINKFYTGWIYPLVVTFFITIAAICAAELFLAGVVVLLFMGACIFSNTAKPLIITVVSFVLQISRQYSPSPSVSDMHDYYFSSWRFPVFVVYITAIVISLAFFFVKNGCYKRMSIKRDILLLPTILLCTAFLLSGVFYTDFIVGIPFSLIQIGTFSLVYFIFAYGFAEEESVGELSGYFSYVSVVVSGGILVQLAHLYLTSDNIFVDGGINKVGVMLGWGSWALIGLTLAMLIPVIFIGAMRGGRYSAVYFIAATLAFFGAIFSMSRAAQLVGALAYLACLVIGAFKADSKLIYRISLGIALICTAVGVVMLWDKLPTMLVEFFDDNGRAEHAKIAIDNFKLAPVFGVGFLNFESVTQIPYMYAPMGPWPAMAHNTVLELLSATGIFGLCAYLLYRCASILPVFKKPTLDKSLIFISVLVVLSASMLDNFVFDVYPMFYSLIALAIIHKKQV